MSKITPLSAEQITQLAAMQDHLNQLTCQANFGHPDWRSMNFNWGRAIVDEVMEIHGHLGWKWWKGSDKYQVGVTSKNKKQIQLEVIDILHFGLSYELSVGDLPTGATNLPLNMEECLTELVQGKLTVNDWDVLYTLCCHVDLDATQIMETYIGKYALNIFRQDNGYGDGSYHKIWAGQEDNVWLEKVIDKLARPVMTEKKEVNVENVTELLTYYYKLWGGK